MQQTAPYDTELLLRDARSKGWQPADLADNAEVARSTVSRFLSGEHQTARTIKKLAKALGRPISRYLVRSEQGAVA